MELEKQVCSLELSKIIEQLGFNKKSLFCWVDHGNGKFSVMLTQTWASECNTHCYVCSALTVAELGEMLPRLHASYKEDEDLFICCQFEYQNGYRTESKNEADARALMIIYLIENGLINKEVNHEQGSQ